MPGNHKIAWGIDVGQYGLRAVKLELSGSGVQVSDFDIIDYPQPLSDLPAASHDQTIRQALGQFVSRHSTRGAAVVAGVPGRNSQARFVALPPVEPKKIPQIVEFEAKQQIPFDMDDVVWDYQAIKLEDSPDVIAGIFFIKRDVVESFLANFQHVGILTDQVQMAPMALYNAMIYDGLTDPAAATAIIDVGSANTEFIVADGQRVFHRTIPIGGNTFTQALVKTFKLSFGKAENLKRKCATSKYAKQVFQAMRSVFSDLASEVQRSIGFYTTLNRQAKIGRILAVGNTFRLPGLQKYLQQSLKLDLIRVDQFSKLTISPKVKAPAFSAEVLSLGVAYGLALQGLGKATLATNLLPPSIGHQQVWRAKRPVFAAAVALLAVIVGGLFARGLMDRAALSGPVHSKDPDSPGSVITRAEQYKSELQRVDVAIAADRKNLEDYAALVAQRDVWPAIMRAVSKSLQTAADPAAEYAKPRGQRRLIFLQNLSSKYCEDVDKEYDQRYGQAASAPLFTTSPSTSIRPGTSPAKKGFIMELRAITPFQGDEQTKTKTNEFINTEVVQRLVQEAQAELANLTTDLAKVSDVKIDCSCSSPQLWKLQTLGGIAVNASTTGPFSATTPTARSTTTAASAVKLPDPARPNESMADDQYFCIHWRVYIEQSKAGPMPKPSAPSVAPKPGPLPKGP